MQKHIHLNNIDNYENDNDDDDEDDDDDKDLCSYIVCFDNCNLNINFILKQSKYWRNCFYLSIASTADFGVDCRRSINLFSHVIYFRF